MGTLQGIKQVTRYSMDDLYLSIRHYRTLRTRANHDRVQDIALYLFAAGELSREQLDIITL